jgi:hypothetical protein
MAAVSVVVVAAAGAAAVGIDKGLRIGHRYYIRYIEHQGAPQTGPGGSTGPGASSTTSTTLSGPALCDASQLNGGVYDWNGTSGTMYENIQLTNSSQQACTLNGFPQVAAADVNGTSLPSPTQNLATLGSATFGITQPGKPLVLNPGDRSWFELDFDESCASVLPTGTPANGTTGACYPGSQLQVTPSKTSAPVLVSEPLRFDYGTIGFQVGPYLPGTPPVTSPGP